MTTLEVEGAPAALRGEASNAEVSGRYTGTETETFPISLDRPEATHDRRPAERPRRGWYSTRPHETLVPQDTTVYTPRREVYIDGERMGVDRDIEINAGESGYSVATVTLWNLSTQTWGLISRNSRLEIHLGWDDEVTPVFYGDVLTKRPRYRGGDVGYVIRARSHSASQLHSRGARAYGQVSPHFIIDDIVQYMNGVESGHISTESHQMDKEYVITTARSIADWLDDLADIAREQTGRRWVWYVDKDKLSFHPRTDQTSDVVVFGANKTVRRATPAGMTPPEREHSMIELVSRCEPITSRSVTCRVEGMDAVEESELFRVSKYIHQSGTTTGKHHTTMLLEPLDTTLDEVWVA